MIIAVDFDGTIVEHKYPKIGAEIPFAFETLIKLQKEDFHQLILWTVRTGQELEEAVEYCKSKGLQFYAHNKNYPEEPTLSAAPRKLVADIFIDDRNVGGLPDWGIIYRQINGLTEFSDSRYNRAPKKIKRNIFIRFGEWIENLK
jgi:hypothetical protein